MKKLLTILLFLSLGLFLTACGTKDDLGDNGDTDKDETVTPEVKKLEMYDIQYVIKNAKQFELTFKFENLTYEEEIYLTTTEEIKSTDKRLYPDRYNGGLHYLSFYRTGGTYYLHAKLGEQYDVQKIEVPEIMPTVTKINDNCRFDYNFSNNKFDDFTKTIYKSSNEEINDKVNVINTSTSNDSFLDNNFSDEEPYYYLKLTNGRVSYVTSRITLVEYMLDNVTGEIYLFNNESQLDLRVNCDFGIGHGPYKYDLFLKSDDLSYKASIKYRINLLDLESDRIYDVLFYNNEYDTYSIFNSSYFTNLNETITFDGVNYTLIDVEGIVKVKVETI